MMFTTQVRLPQQDDPHYIAPKPKFFEWKKWLVSLAGIAAMFGIGFGLWIITNPEVMPSRMNYANATPQWALQRLAEMDAAASMTNSAQASNGLPMGWILMVVVACALVAVFVSRHIMAKKSAREWGAVAATARQVRENRALAA